MYSQEQLIEFHNEIRSVKEHMWYDHKDPDLYPILVVRWRDMDMQAVNVPAMGTLIETAREAAKARGVHNWLIDTDMSAPLVLWSCLGALSDGVAIPGVERVPPKGTPLEAIWLACEGYGLEATDEEMEAHERGDLKADYENNPDSKVFERLTTYQVETSSTGLAEWARVTSAFHKDDGGRIVWHEPLISTSEEEQPEGGFDRLLEIMCPHVTRENLT